jgi:hypothetical protein
MLYRIHVAMSVEKTSTKKDSTLFWEKGTRFTENCLLLSIISPFFFKSVTI